MADVLTRLRNPPFGTETSERNLMAAAADEIERLRNELEVSEACNKAKTMLILEIKNLLDEQTGPPRTKKKPADLREFLVRLDQQQMKTEG